MENKYLQRKRIKQKKLFFSSNNEIKVCVYIVTEKENRIVGGMEVKIFLRYFSYI